MNSTHQFRELNSLFLDFMMQASEAAYEFEEDISVRICDSEGSTEDESNDQDSTDANIEILQQRMISAYKKAGSMMLVSSVTTSICFFSNAFGVLTVIQEFGIYMG